MKKILNLCTILCLSAVAMTGCYEDKGNYDYSNARIVIVKNIQSSYNRVLGQDTISINPQMWAGYTTNNVAFIEPGNPDDYSFEWQLLGGKVGGVTYNEYVISTEQRLNKHQLNLPEGEHLLCLKVTDKDGVSFFSDRFNVRVESQLGRGLLIMTEVNNATRLDYLNYFNNNVSLITDITGMVGSEAPLEGKPLGVACYFDPNAPYAGIGTADGYAIAVMTETDAYFLNPTDFSYQSEYYDFRDHFVIKPAYNFKPSKIIVQRADYGTNSGLMYDGGTQKLYLNFGMFMMYWSATQTIHPNPPAGFSPSPHAVYGAMTAVFFDETTKSFYNNMPMMVAMMGTPPNLYSHADLRNTGKDLVMLQDQNTHVIAIMKDPATGKYTLLQFAHMDDGKLLKFDLDLPEGNKIEEFAMMWSSTPFVYFRTDEKIYVLSINDLSTRQVYSTTDAARRGGTKISKIKFVRNGSSANESVWMDNLLVFTYDPSLPEESCGTLEMYKSDGAAGNLKLVEFEKQTMVFGGLGKVVDADFKQK